MVSEYGWHFDMHIGIETPDTDTIAERMRLGGAMIQDQSGHVIKPRVCCL